MDAARKLLLQASWRPSGAKGDSVQTALRALISALLVWTITCSFAAGEVRVERTKPVTSPDAAKAVVVDRILPVVDGEVENFSGKMLVRVTDQGGNTLKQRYIETSQIQLVYQPVWLDDQWCAFAYSIWKNANGMIYFNLSTGEAFQVELVATSRLMGATGKTETELTSFEVAHYGDKVTRISNVPHAGGSVFPLYLPSIPAFTNTPFPKSFLEQLIQAYQAQADFCKAHAIDSLEIEQGSESFNPSDSQMALLACLGNAPGLFLVPLKDKSTSAALAATRVVKLGPDVVLTCAADSPETTEPQENQEAKDPGEGERARYATGWKDDTHAFVGKELFAAEDETPQKQEIYLVSLSGELTKVAPTVTPKPQPTAAPHKAVKAAPATATPKASALGQTHKRAAQPHATAAASKTPRPAQASPRAAAASPAATAQPSPTTQERQGLLRRMLPKKTQTP